MRQPIMGGTRGKWLAGAAVLLAACVMPARAQGTGNGYLFGVPDGGLTIRFGYAAASANSDFYRQTTSLFNLDKSDFSGPTVGAELDVRIAPQFDVGLDLSWAGVTRQSHYRNFVDNNDQEIEQSTSVHRVPVMVNVKAYLAPRGRSVGRLAYIPSKVVPWVGAGVGADWWKVEQSGDFINTATGVVYNDKVTDSGWGPAVQGIGGVDITLTPRIALTGDARYVWSKASMGSDFGGFDKIDLSGVSVALGVTFRL
jgi:hypothetical protein